MPYTVPTAAQFKQRYPAFADTDDTLIDTVLADASRSVGTDWMEADYQPATMALAAHTLSREGAVTSGTGSAAGPVTSMSFDGMSVSFASLSGAGSASELGTTIYGQTYLRFLRANVPGAFTLRGTL